MKKRTRKLSLFRETVRNLTPGQMGNVQGGSNGTNTWPGSNTCPSYGCGTGGPSHTPDCGASWLGTCACGGGASDLCPSGDVACINP
jgi:hypothetical protein